MLGKGVVGSVAGEASVNMWTRRCKARRVGLRKSATAKARAIRSVNPAAMVRMASEEVQNEGRRHFAATCPGAEGTALRDCPWAPRGAG